MRIVFDAYKHLGRKLKDEVLDEHGQPDIQAVDLWAEQTEFEELVAEMQLPAILFDFGSDQISTQGLWVQDINLQTTMYIVASDLEYSNLEAAERGHGLHYLERLARVHELLQGYEHPACGNLNRIGFAPVSTRTNLLVYRLTYASIVTDYSAMDKRRDTRPDQLTVEGPDKRTPAVTTGDNQPLFNIPL